jgi:LPS-assembly lipoprotein
MRLRAALALCLSALLAACGFSPAYAPGPANTGMIRIAEIEGRTGHALRRELLYSVGRGVPGLSQQADLTIVLDESIVRLGYTPDQAASRSDYVGEAVWTLKSADGATIASGQAREAASFNYADAAYADVAAQTAAQERVAAMLARAVRLQILAEVGRTRATTSQNTP